MAAQVTAYPRPYEPLDLLLATCIDDVPSQVSLIDFVRSTWRSRLWRGVAKYGVYAPESTAQSAEVVERGDVWLGAFLLEVLSSWGVQGADQGANMVAIGLR